MHLCARRNHPCVLCYRQHPGYPSGLAVRRVVCICVIQAIKDKKLNTSNTPPELNFQNSHPESQPRSNPSTLSSQIENDHSKFGGQQIHSSSLDALRTWQTFSGKAFVCAVVTTPRERHRPLSISIIADSAIVRLFWKDIPLSQLNDLFIYRVCFLHDA